MQSVAYDLHLHSCLSPCGDEDMTPNNIVNMSLLKGLDVIAITDHNTMGNAKAVMECAEGTNLIVIPGMEIETSEEVHMVCLFKNLSDAYKFWDIVKENMPEIKNKEEIFGRQIYMDKNDEITGIEENLLTVATYLSINDVYENVKNIGGVSFPSHIDKPSYSVISNLGFIPPELKFNTLEIKMKEKKDELVSKHRLLEYKIIHNSDAHYLENISERENFIHIEKKDIEGILNVLWLIKVLLDFYKKCGTIYIVWLNFRQRRHWKWVREEKNATKFLI